MPVANRVEAFAITVPAGTAQASPQVTSTTFDDGSVVRIELDVPDGHFGLTGIQILAAGAQYIPKTNGTYLIADGHDFAWDVIVTIDTGAWSVQAYNTDVYDHTFYLRFSVLDFAFQTATVGSPTLQPTPVLV